VHSALLQKACAPVGVYTQQFCIFVFLNANERKFIAKTNRIGRAATFLNHSSTSLNGSKLLAIFKGSTASFFLFFAVKGSLYLCK
jgi:hypothetical protein